MATNCRGPENIELDRNAAKQVTSKKNKQKSNNKNKPVEVDFMPKLLQCIM